jgi:hypothetical protein
MTFDELRRHDLVRDADLVDLDCKREQIDIFDGSNYVLFDHLDEEEMDRLLECLEKSL